MTTGADVAIVGAGAIGQFYGAQLVLAGHRVRFLARRDANVLRERGIVLHQTPTKQIASSLRENLVRIPPESYQTATTTDELLRDGYPDWVWVALKIAQPRDIRSIVEPILGPRSEVAFLSNGLGLEEECAAWFSPARIYGLLCFVCVNRDDDGRVRHLAFGHVMAGHFLDDGAARRRLVELCSSAGIDATDCPALLEARWRKLAWNVPFNGLCVANDTTTDRIVGRKETRAEALALAGEIIAIGNAELAARALPGRIELSWAEEQLRRTDTMGPYAPSTLIDFRAGRALEREALFVEPLRRAERFGVEAPHLRSLVERLERIAQPVP